MHIFSVFFLLEKIVDFDIIVSSFLIYLCASGLVNYYSIKRMIEDGEIESADDEMPSLGRRQYRPVVSHEGSAVQIQSMESGSLPEIPLK